MFCFEMLLSFSLHTSTEELHSSFPAFLKEGWQLSPLLSVNSGSAHFSLPVSL